MSDNLPYRLRHDYDVNTSNVWLREQAADEIERLRAELAARPALTPVTTEQLDKLQFGRVLHERPAPSRKEYAMTKQRIMYCCDECIDNYPEHCGRFDRNDLRLMPDGRWLCESCFDDTTQADRGNTDEDKYLSWSDLPPAPEYFTVKWTV